MEQVKDQIMWFIQDDDECFAKKDSIFESGKNTWLYISFKVFTPECRGYITKKTAENALVKLNRMNNVAEFDTNFHLKTYDVDILIQQNKNFVGESMVVYEKDMFQKIPIKEAIYV